MLNKRYKIIFMGTPDFAVPGLKALHLDPKFELVSVITQADKAVGRKQEIIFPAVKKAALELNIPVLQPDKLKDIYQELLDLNPDFIVVIAYGKILSPKILATPKIACINVHASLLPKYRGSACLQAPILNGDQETGVTIMLMDKGLDTGDILVQEQISLNEQTSLEYIHDSLSEAGAKILGETLIKYANQEIIPQKQDESLSSYVREIEKKDGQIDWTNDAITIERKIRAFTPWPGAFSHLEGKMLKIIKAKALNIETNNSSKIGEILATNSGIAIKCGQNYLDILELQLEGKKAMNTQSFLSGHQNIIGKVLS